MLGDLDEAEDVTQDAFAKACLHWGRIAAYDQPEAPGAAGDLQPGLQPHAPGPRAAGPRHREVLVLHYVAELPLDEVARQLRLPLGTVKSRLSRARSALATQVGDERQGGRQCVTT